MGKKLEYGQTPWDTMPREQLLQELWRFYLATQSAYSILASMQRLHTGSLFWDKGGRGGATVEQCSQALAHANTYEDESAYRAFFRYAPDLLFIDNTGANMIGFGWAVCDTCGIMLGAGTNGENRRMGQPCASSGVDNSDCPGRFRQLLWADLGRPELGVSQK